MIPPPPRSTLFPYTTLFRSDLSTQERVLVDLAVTQKLLLGSIDSWLLVQPSLVNARKRAVLPVVKDRQRSEEHTSELQARSDLVCRLLLEKKRTEEN